MSSIHSRLPIHPRYLPYLPPLLAIVYLVVLFLVVQPVHAHVSHGKWPSNRTEWRNGWTMGSTAYNNGVTAGNRWDKNSTGKNFYITHFTATGPVRVNTSSVSFRARGWAADPGLTSVHYSSGTTLQSGALYLNSDWTFNTSCTFDRAQKKADLLTVQLHEFGHVVGLNHDPAQPGAVMWPNYTCKQTLRTDDKNGIAALYP